MSTTIQRYLPWQAVMLIAAGVSEFDTEGRDRGILKGIKSRHFPGYVSQSGVVTNWLISEEQIEGKIHLRLTSAPYLGHNNRSGDQVTQYVFPIESARKIAVSIDNCIIRGGELGVDKVKPVAVKGSKAALAEEIAQLEKQVEAAEDWGKTCSRRTQEAETKRDLLQETVKDQATLLAEKDEKLKEAERLLAAQEEKIAQLEAQLSDQAADLIMAENGDLGDEATPKTLAEMAGDEGG